MGAALLGSRFLMISIAAHLLFGLGAAYWVVQRYQANRKLTFKGGPPSPNPSTRALEHKVQMAKKQSTMSAPAICQANRLNRSGQGVVTGYAGHAAAGRPASEDGRSGRH